MKTAANVDDTGPRADNPDRHNLVRRSLPGWSKHFSTAQQDRDVESHQHFRSDRRRSAKSAGSLTLVNPPTAAEYGLLGNITSIMRRLIRVHDCDRGRYGRLVVGHRFPHEPPPNTTIASVTTTGTTFTAPILLGNRRSERHDPHIERRRDAYSPVTSDGGKSWMGGYRAERNALLKFIAHHGIHNVVFLATDDHQNRINELLYSPTGQTGDQTTYIKVPYCFEIVCGPLVPPVLI